MYPGDSLVGWLIYAPCLCLSQLEFLPGSHLCGENTGSTLPEMSGRNEPLRQNFPWRAEAVRNGVIQRSERALGGTKEPYFLLLAKGTVSHPATRTRAGSCP